MNDDFNEETEEEYTPRHAKDKLENIEPEEELTPTEELSTNTDYEEIEENKKEETGSWEIPQNAYTKPKKKSSLLSSLLIIIFLGMMIFSIYKIINWAIDNKKTGDSIKKIEKNTVVVEVEDNENTELLGEEEDKDNPYWYYITFPLIDVDISKLKQENSDTVGWINVNNTNINYPFVQTDNNDYYLEHSFSRDYNEAGWLFLDYRNDKSFSNANNIIYGHSRLDKTMFGSLNKALKSSWYSNRDNHVIRISLENENTLWQIFSVYKIEAESYYITTAFSTPTSYLEFLNTIKGRSIYDFQANLTENDKILTLSTCYSDTERTVVHARLIKREKK